MQVISWTIYVYIVHKIYVNFTDYTSIYVIKKRDDIQFSIVKQLYSKYSSR